MKRIGGLGFLAVLIIALVLALGGCGGGPKPPQKTATPQPSPPPTTQPTQPTPPTSPASPIKPTQPQTPSASTIQVLQVTAFPDNGYLLAGSGATFVARVQAPTAIQTKLELKLDDQVATSQALDLQAGEPQIVPLQLGPIKTAGDHTVSIGAWTTQLHVIEPASSPARPGTIPEDAQVLTADEGLTEPGIPGGKLVVTEFGGGPKTLNPATAAETTSTDIIGMMQAGLFDINPLTADLIPGLAQSWAIASDGKSVTLSLRHGVKWSDGQPFTADDVVFTFMDVIGNDDVNTNIRDGCTIGGQFVQVEKIDDYTVKASVVQPYRPLLRDCLGNTILPKHLLAQYVAKLNPGATGDLQGIQSTVNNSRDDLQKAGANALAALDGALKQLGQAIDGKDAAKVKTAVDLAQQALDQLLKAVPAGALHDGLQAAKDYANRALQDAQAGRFAGVSPDAFNNAWNPNTPPDQFAGLGPYVLDSYQIGQQVLLKRNPYYWRVDEHGVQLPYLDQVAVLIVQNIDTQFLYFKSGQADMYGARPEDWAEILADAQAKGWRTIKDGPGYGTNFVAVNQDIAKLKPNDPVYQALQYVMRAKEFRQALSYAIDRQAMIDNIFRGLAAPQWTDISVPSPFYDAESAKTYPFDPQKANQMLDALNLVDTNKNGTRKITDKFLMAQQACTDSTDCAQKFGPEEKREISFPLSTNVGNSIREAISQQIEHDWKAVGVQVTYQPEQFNALVTDLQGSRYGAIVLGLTGGVDPSGGLNVWRVNGFLHFWRYSSKDNPPDWEKRVQQLMDDGATVFDIQEAKDKYYKEFERLVSENLPMIYLILPVFLYATDQCLENSQNFRPQAGNVPQWGAFNDKLWWQRGGDCESKLEKNGRLSAPSTPSS